MPTQSIIAAIQTKWDALTASGFPSSTIPPLYFEEAPVVNGSGVQVHPTTAGYAVLKDNGHSVKSMAFGVVAKEVASLEFEIYYPSLGDCLTAALAVQLNGSTEAAHLGFDYGSLPALSTPLVLLAIIPRSSQGGFAGMGKTGVPVHVWKLGYDFEFTRS
jgi:hypothetical protein